MTNSGGDISSESVNGSARRAAELPAHGGIANARGLARLYAPLSLDGAAGGHRLVSAERLPAMRNVRAASDCDVMLRLPTTFTLGYSKFWGARSLGAGSHVIIGEDAFGTPGMGGSIGFADTGARMSFGYVMNKHGGGVGLNERGQALVDAAYRSVGFTSSERGSGRGERVGKSVRPVGQGSAGHRLLAWHRPGDRGGAGGGGRIRRDLQPHAGGVR